MPLPSLTLAFGDPELEARYRGHAAKEHAGTVRAAIGLALLLYLCFGLLDVLLCPEQASALCVLRYALISPWLVAALVFAYAAPAQFERHQQATLFAVSLIGGLGIVAMTGI